MVGNDADANNSPSQNNNKNSYTEYLTRAAQACAAGDVVLGLHLYLAAYERALQDSYVPDPVVIEGLRQAWNLACQHKERSLAEYIFEKLEPYLSAEEVTQYATQLQRLALDKLEEFGLTREDLEDMTDMISQDFFGLDPNALLMRIEQGVPNADIFGNFYKGLKRDKSNEDIDAIASDPQASKAAVDDKQINDVHTSEVDSTKKSELQPEDESGAQTKPDKEEKEATNGDSSLQKQQPLSGLHHSGMHQDAESNQSSSGSYPLKNEIPLMPFNLPAISTNSSGSQEIQEEKMTYKDLVGYEKAIETMRGLGIGIEDDPQFKELLQTLNAQHGLDKIPVTDSFLFRSLVREDAHQFMIATMGEIGLPAIRMRMEENLQGMPVLCVMASTDNQPKLNAAKNAIEGGGVLLLEDVDLWGSPLTEHGTEDLGNFMFAQLSRGAREAIKLIRSAVENPNVYVLVSAAQEGAIDAFFFDLLDPLTVVDIEQPNSSERADLWTSIAKEHPSLRTIDRAQLVKYSSGMSRYDIYMAAREAVEDAYKYSLMTRKYVAVSSENVFEKIAAYQPLESDEYQELENAVIDKFRTELDSIDDILKGDD